MSSTGVREGDTTPKRLIRGLILNEAQFIQSLRVFANTSSLSGLGNPVGDSSNAPQSPSSNSLQKDGDMWSGQHGSNFQITTIENGQIDASKSTGVSFPMIVVNPEGGNDDFLDKFIPGSDILFYQEQLIQTVVKPITIRPQLSLAISNVVGVGTVIATVVSTALLTSGDKVIISGFTSNFDVDDAIITVTGGTTFTYPATGSGTPDTNGTLTRGNIATPDNANFVSGVNTISHFTFDTINQLYRLDYSSAGIGGGSGGGSGYDTIQEEGASVVQRSVMNFIGATVTAVDNPGALRTDITITPGTAGLLSDLTINANKDWNGKSISNISGITMAGDFDVNSFDVLKVDRLKFIRDSGALIAVGDPTIYVSAGTGIDDNLVINNIDTKAIVFSHSNEIGLQATVSTLRKERKNGLPFLDIVRTGTVPTTGITIADIRGIFPRTTGGETLSAIISFTAEDTGNTTFEGGLAIQVNKFNGQVLFMDFNNGKSDEIRMYKGLNLASNDIVNVDRLQFVRNAGALIAVNNPTIYVSAGTGIDDNLVINNIDTKAIVFTHSNVIGLQDSVSTLRKSRTNGLPIISIVREGTTPGLGNAIAEIDGRFPRTTGGETESGLITFTAEDIGNTTHEGGIAFQVNQTGTRNIFMRLNDGKNNLIDMFRDVDFNNHFAQFTEITKPANPAVNKGRFYVRDNGGTSTPYFLDAVGTETSLIGAAAIPNQIIQGNTSVTVTDAGTGVINFEVDGTPLGNMSIVGGWNIDNAGINLSSTSGFISFQNGFKIDNANSTTTTFEIPNNEILLIKEGSSTRIQIDNDVTLNSKSNNDILLQVGGSTKILLDGSTNRFIVQGNTELRINSGSFINFASGGSPTVGSEVGRVQIKIAGVLRSIPFFAA